MVRDRPQVSSDSLAGIGCFPSTGIPLFGSPHAFHLTALGLYFLVMKGERGSSYSTRPGPFLGPGVVVISGISKTLLSCVHNPMW